MADVVANEPKKESSKVIDSKSLEDIKLCTFETQRHTQGNNSYDN